jgi:hypothetical protein
MQTRTISVLNVKESPLMRTNRSINGTESGFALVLAMLALLLLTFLGLTLAVTTSTELQIATNYRWSEQARYVAEAGIEAGKVMLRETITWENLLPAPRPGTWDGGTAPTGPYVAPRANIRDYENWECDDKGSGLGYGRVLDGTALGGGTAVPQQYISQFGGQTLSGAFTLWVRRPLHYLPDGTIADWGGTGNFGPLVGMPGDNNNLVLVAEGMAPFTGVGTTAQQQAMMGRAKATYIIEVALSKTPPVLEGCDAPYSGQAGTGADGANNSKCERLSGNAMDVAARGSDSSTLAGGGTITEFQAR